MPLEGRPAVLAVRAGDVPLHALASAIRGRLGEDAETTCDVEKTFATLGGLAHLETKPIPWRLFCCFCEDMTYSIPIGYTDVIRCCSFLSFLQFLFFRPFCSGGAADSAEVLRLSLDQRLQDLALAEISYRHVNQNQARVAKNQTKIWVADGFLFFSIWFGDVFAEQKSRFGSLGMPSRGSCMTFKANLTLGGFR